ncbi:mitotic spindle assembly checkpoint protein MAD1 [Athalia rosae]|uniref:mitotic spindle assembly checkpoint protein MAD1 n=1 Tax=Athalia rosae TaxID=37344 RepID=UPI002034694F|nr:mitotic spindle assembly checkpoint protein MAD1 [Athalia rosae]XP_048512131.1 mitotic spindle assembly checkpoint protein MAD1 [Athalia rosae]
MDDDDPTCVVQMIKDLRSGTGSFRGDSRMSSGLRLSSASFMPSSSIVADNEDDDGKPAVKKSRLDDSSTSVNRSSLDGIPSSPWEWRKLKGEVISLRTRLLHQEATVEQLHNIRKQMEQVFDKEKKLFELQSQQDKQLIKQLEARLDVARRVVQEAKEAKSSAKKELAEVKAMLDQKTIVLINENVKLQDELKQTNSSHQQLSALDTSKEDSTELAEKLNAAKERISHLEERLQEARAIQQKSELLELELQDLKIKNERLESEKSLCEEGKIMAARAARASDLEKELHAANKLVSTLREAVKGKLFLEEQICSMQQRVQHTEMLEMRIAKLEVQRAELQSQVREYESIGITGGPFALKKELQRLQQTELILTAEEGQLRSKMESTQRECQSLLKKYEETKTLASEMTVVREKLNKLISRLQKKMMLVSRERDSYRQQLDLYEKEMTVDGNSVLTERVPALERAIDGYRELVRKLESDLEAAEDCVQKAQCQKLREEVDRLKGELEHRALKGDFNCNARVLHFKMNPAAMAEKQAEEKHLALLREVEELRARLATGNTTLGPVGSSLHAQEIAELKHTYEIKITRLKEAFKASSQEYRQACYQLFGWRVDRTKEGRYKLSSQYAESPDDYLFFQVGEEGVDLLETEFSATLGHLIERHLQIQHSVPMFLIAVQSDLFSQQTAATVAS